jgi:hypothetical protein
LLIYNQPAMLDIYLVPEKTVVSAKGDGPAVDIGALANRALLLQLQVSGIVEQESLEVSVFGGPDEKAIAAAPLASFPQLFYRGEYPLLLDLSAQPQVKVLRAHWEVNRWGRGPEKPWFEFSLKATEVSPELMRERQAQARQP